MPEILLPQAGWIHELDEHKEILKEARNLLDRIIIHYNNDEPGITATPELIEMAQKHLSDGVSIGGKKFEIKVFIPDENNSTDRTFFLLEKRYAGGTVKSLSEC